MPRSLKEETLIFLAFAQRTKGTLLAKGNLYRQMMHRKEGKKESLIHPTL